MRASSDSQATWENCSAVQCIREATGLQPTEEKPPDNCTSDTTRVHSFVPIKTVLVTERASRVLDHICSRVRRLKSKSVDTMYIGKYGRRETGTAYVHNMGVYQ